MASALVVFAPVILLVLVVYFIFSGAKLPGRRKKDLDSKGKIVPTLQASHPKLGNLPDVKTAGSFYQFISALHRRLGPVAGFWFGKQRCVSLASTKAFKDVHVLFDRPAIFFNFFEPLFTTHSITFTNGAEGRRRHGAYLAAMNAKECGLILPKLNEVAKEFCDGWDSNTPDDHIPLFENMMALAVRSFARIHLGIHNEDEVKELQKAHDLIWDEMEARFLGEFDPDDAEREEAFQAKIGRMQRLSQRIVDEHKKARESVDYESAPLLDAILETTPDNEDVQYSDCVSFILGGFNTVGTLLTWVFYFLSKHSDAQEKVFEEIDAVLEGGQKQLDAENIKELKYVKHLIDETFRLSLQSSFAGRVSPERDCVVAGHRVRTGTPMLLSYGLGMQDQRIFPQPEKFDPSRFSWVSPTAALSFRPFGSGPRQCPGRYFALHEVYSAVAAVVARFRIGPAATEAELPDVGRKFGLNTKPDREVWVSLRKRA